MAKFAVAVNVVAQVYVSGTVEAARILGITRQSLYRRMEKFELKE
ncbi:MAG: hypothetical protein K2M55_07455 [Muribaculaceae bacterium]|nr:hypothetical protein [Muribaculaceae bacterium]